MSGHAAHSLAHDSLAGGVLTGEPCPRRGGAHLLPRQVTSLNLKCDGDMKEMRVWEGGTERDQATCAFTNSLLR